MRDQPVFSREVRLGIVMYGGVSLAVYENGVAQEFFRAVKGEGVYKLIKLLIDSDIVVDIMSGTSAGGINGIMLGYALANHRDFIPSASLWRNYGDILQLLRKPSDPETLSILDSRGFYQQHLESAFQSMNEYNPKDRVPTLESAMEELDVFITGTDVHGRIFTEFDEEGHHIDVKDHRQVFQLSYRQGRKNDFSERAWEGADEGFNANQPHAYAALAKLSRTTSCFPVAFEPVRLPDPRDDKMADARMRVWGRVPEDHASYFLDGGLLDNKPFSYTIHEIFHRTATRPSERMLFYVEPDPESFVDTVPSEAPSITQSALNALVSIPGYQSIATDLQEIAEHNDRVQAFEEVMHAAEESALPKREHSRREDATLPKDAAGKGGLDLVSDAGRRAQYLECRLNQIMKRGVEGILKQNGQRMQLRDRGEIHAAKILVTSFSDLLNPPQDELKDEERLSLAENILLKFDVYFRMRRLFWLTYKLDQMLQKFKPGDDEYRGYSALWLRVNHHIKMLEMVQFAMESVVDQAPIEWKNLKETTASRKVAKETWKKLENVLLELLDSGKIETRGKPVKLLTSKIPSIELSPADLKEERENFMIALKQRMAFAAQSAGEVTPGVEGELLLQTLDQQEEALLRSAPKGTLGKIYTTYWQFPIIDSYTFPMQFLADMESTEPIHTVRISPIDAQRGFSARSLSEKVRGIELGHFGGFMKSSWRANDIMWGRLDAVCEMVECLVTPERIRKLVAMNLFAPQCFSPGVLKTYFPKAPDAEVNLLSQMLSRLGDLAAEAEARPQASEPFWELLTRMAQREILAEEIPNVICSAIRQHRDWNQYGRLKSAPNLKMSSSPAVVTWETGVNELDEAITSYAAALLGSRDSEPPEGWDGFFMDKYRVAEENVGTGVPKPILSEIVAQAAIRLRESLVSSAGKRAETIRSSWAYKFALKWPVNAAYMFFRTQRTLPEWAGRITWAWIVGLLGVVVFGTALLRQTASGHFCQYWKWIFIPGLALILTLLVLAWWRIPARAKQGRRPRKFYVQAQDVSEWCKFLPTLPFARGAEFLRDVVSKMENSGFQPDVERLWRTDPFAVLQGEKEIRAYGPSPKDENDEASLASVQWFLTMSIADERWPFRISEKK